ncbi:MAG: hypothetical protein IPO15_24825 [Anaerolineae bacterium]|uniref:hypothetical protein n=1 Tax=Candidatus Amarolinea dominans TaxID=3140696 RepID=UPI003134AFCB|nr:hypothetical protein [Anaerolineae bacterium]
MRISLKASIITLLAIILLTACADIPPGAAPNETAADADPRLHRPAATSPGVCVWWTSRRIYVPSGYHAVFYGPPLDDYPLDPLRGALSLTEPGLALGRTVTQVVDEFLQSPGPHQGQALSIVRETLTIGGEPAELLKDVQGEAALTWQAFVVHNNRIYHFVLFPMNDGLAQARPDIDAVWQAVQKSFTFLEAAPPDAVPMEATPVR